MTKKEVIENNKLIAEFMGYKNTTPTDKDFNIYENEEGKMLEAMSMAYHKSWDLLMEVIEHIAINGKRAEAASRALPGDVFIDEFTMGLSSIFITADIWRNSIDGWQSVQSYHRYIPHKPQFSDSRSLHEAYYKGIVDYVKWDVKDENI